MLKKILSIILCLSIFVCSVFICVPFSVKADNIYNTIYENYDYSSVISQHKTFSFTDKGGKKHTVFKATSSSAWICVFGSRQVISDDDELNYYLSWYSYTGYQSKLNAFSQFLVAQMGAITKGASTILEDSINNCSNIDIDYNDNDGLLISSDSVDKLREQLKKQYYDSIGMNISKPVNTPQFLIGKLIANYEHEEDYISDFNNFKGQKYVFGFFNDNYKLALKFNLDTDTDYFYIDDNNKLIAIDSNVENIINYSVSIISYGVYGSYYPVSIENLIKNICYDNYYKNTSGGLSCEPIAFQGNLYIDCHAPLYYYSDSDKPLFIFRSYESMYNYLKGSQTAYLSSKVEEKGEDIKISIDDMNTNISDKMDELIDSINSGKGSMSADELQKAIDKGLESISGKMDDIKDNTQETNNKLDSLLTVMQSQNEILMNILGVTTDIYTVVSSKDDEQDKAYDINYVQAVFNTMFKGLKNAVLYGQNTIKQDVNQDTDDVNSLVTDVSSDKVNYRNGLFGKFPFSVPYQLFEWLQVLCVEPVAPSFTLSYDFLLKDFINDENRDNFKLIIDLNDDKYKEWADLMRSGEKLAFTIYMAIATYNRFKNEV